MIRLFCALLAAAGLTGCVSSPAPEPQPYLANHRPLEAAPGAVIVYPTGALSGRLEVVGGCFALVSADGAAWLVSFGPQVRVVRSRGRWGILDSAAGRRAMQGDMIGVGGSSPPEPDRFIADRVTSGDPPPACPDRLFASNSGFSRP